MAVALDQTFTKACGWKRMLKGLELLSEPLLLRCALAGRLNSWSAGCIRSSLLRCNTAPSNGSAAATATGSPQTQQLPRLCRNPLPPTRSSSSSSSKCSFPDSCPASCRFSISVCAWPAPLAAPHAPAALRQVVLAPVTAHAAVQPSAAMSTAATRTLHSSARAAGAAAGHAPAGGAAAPRRRRRVPVPAKEEASAAALPPDGAPDRPATHVSINETDSSPTATLGRLLGSLVRGPLGGQQQAPAVPGPVAAVDAGSESAAGTKGQNQERGTQGQAGAQAGVLQLKGTEEEVFAQVLEYVPPRAAAELAEMAQMANEHRGSRSLPAHKMLATIAKVLDLSQQFPDLDVAPLLQPVIAAAKTRYSLQALLPKVKSMRRLLPDTALREVLLRKDPADVSLTISQAVTAFTSVLAMQPPVQLLSAPQAFAAALHIEPHRLRWHLVLLKRSVSSLEAAQQLAERYTGTLLTHKAERLLSKAQEVATLLNLSQDEAVEVVLRHPHLASTQQQLRHLSALVQDVPHVLGLDQQQWQAMLVKRPELVRYPGSSALAVKHRALSALFPGASVLDILEVCSYRAVISADNVNHILASLRTSAAIMGYDSPQPLLSLLLREPVAYKERPRAVGTGRRPYACLLQPAQKLAARAMHVEKLLGFDRKKFTQMARHFPHTVFSHSSTTQKLKAMLLQVQLLGDGRLGQDDQLAPEIERMLKTCPQLTNLSHQTCLDRVSHLQTVLQLNASQAAQTALKSPALLLYSQDKLAALFSGLSQLLGDEAQARALVLQDARVLFQFSRARAADGQLPVVVMLQRLLAGNSTLATEQERTGSATQTSPQAAMLQPQQQQQRAGAAAAETGSAAALETDSTAALDMLRAEVQAAASAADNQGLVPPMPHKHKGIRQVGLRWEMRHAGRSLYFTSELEAACAYDLARLAADGRPRGVLNLPASLYQPQQVRTVAQCLWKLEQRRRARRVERVDEDRALHPQQQQQQKVPLLPQPQRAQGQQPQPGQAGAEKDPGPALQDVLRLLLVSKAGRVLLGLSPDAALARLQTLSALTGSSVQHVLHKCLSSAGTHYNTVLMLSPTRMEWSASSLQQLLQLSHADTQLLLQKAPLLLQYMESTLSEKVETLVHAFQVCCEAVGSRDASTHAANRGGLNSQQPMMAQRGLPGGDGLECLQRAALRVPEVLLLSSAKLVARLQVLQEVCCQHEALQLQLRECLASGAIGRWLTAGGTHFDTMQRLSAAGSPVLPHLKLSQFVRQPQSTLAELLRAVPGEAEAA